MAIESHKITYRNIGPIEHLDIQLPPNGGVVVLTGRNGTGKSKAIEGLEYLLGNKTSRPTKKDGSERGEISGFGAILGIGARITSKGNVEAVVDHLESSFSIADLVDPGIADQEAADNKRIKALVTARGEVANKDLFLDIFPDKDLFDKIVTRESLRTTDPIEMAARIKRDIEAAARAVESENTKLVATVEATKEDSSYDSSDIVEDFESLVREGASLGSVFIEIKDKYNQWIDLQQQNVTARERLDAIDIEKQKNQIAHYELLVKEGQNRLEDWNKKDIEITQEIEAAQKSLEKANQKGKDLVKEHSSITDLNKQTEKTLEEMKKALDSVKYLEETVEKASKAISVSKEQVEAARESIDKNTNRQVAHKIALEKKQKAQGTSLLTEKIVQNESLGNMLRDLAQKCESTLTKLIGDGSLLFVRDGRIKTMTSRGETSFSELSHGERWTLAIQSVADVVKQRQFGYGILAIPQEAWESMDPINKNLIGELACQYGICIMAAQQSDGPLQQETIVEAKPESDQKQERNDAPERNSIQSFGKNVLPQNITTDLF